MHEDGAVVVSNGRTTGGAEAFSRPGPGAGTDEVEIVFSALAPPDVEGICEALRTAGSALAERPASDVVRVLGRVGGRFADPADPLRREALELLPPTSGLSAAMSEVVLDGMSRDWAEEPLVRMLRADLGTLEALDRFVAREQGRTMAFGPSLCVQIVAGSVPGVGVGALLRSLAVKAPTLLKPGLGDVVLPALFARGLASEDRVLADALAVMYWPGGLEEVERAALARADVVTVYGSDDTVRALRDLTPVTTRFVAYHHRVSVGAVGREALGARAVGTTAAEAARAVALLDQRGCVSPQVIYVEEGGEASVAEFAEALANALSELESRLPSGPLDPSAASALQQLRGTLEMLEGTGATRLWHGGATAPWTVVLTESDDAVPLPAVPRVVRVRPLQDEGRLPSLLEPLAPHLQTLGAAGFSERTDGLAAACGRLGISRMVPFAEVAFPPAWWRHDGRGPVADLVRWVDLL